VNWRWISIAALLAALVLGYGALFDRGAAPVATSEPPPQPGYYLKDAVITETRPDGSLNVRLIAKRIEQQPKDDSISMSTVRVNYFQAPQKEWALSAQRGFVPANSRIVQLEGDVELRPTDAAALSFLRTDALAIDTDKNIAYSTSSPVNIRLGHHAMTVKNFVADLKSEKVRLESVNGRFQPQ
jgi:LPS export ABC transporter protein LptC